MANLKKYDQYWIFPKQDHSDLVLWMVATCGGVHCLKFEADTCICG